MRDMRVWRFVMRAYYAADVLPPKRPGQLVIETKHRSESSLVAEVAAARSRPDIGRVEHNGEHVDAWLSAR